MIYVGARLPRYGSVNCLINPALKVSPHRSDYVGSTVPYWPSYDRINPEARRAYLEWLSTGRSDPGVAICYVFLFFYGLERRLLFDRAAEDAAAIVAEVERLLEIYGENYSFRNYAGRLLEAYAACQDGAGPPQPSPRMGNGYEYQFDVLRHLGRRLVISDRLDADDALLWALAAPQHYLRTPGTRCFDQLVPLWKVRFAERYPEGLRVSAPKSRLKMTYRAASSNFQVELPIGNLPNIANVAGPLRGLHALLDACEEELSSFSRLIGKNPDAIGTLEAAVLLPDALSSDLAAAPLQEARAALHTLMDDQPHPPGFDRCVRRYRREPADLGCQGDEP